jgi:3-oxoacyl-[acyl-carrier protein] reductase
MKYTLDHRVALVTGGSSGIGKSIAENLAIDGANVAICARGKEKLEATAHEIYKSSGTQPLIVQEDLSVYEGCQRFVNKSFKHFGRIDILICCANTPPQMGGNFFAITDEEWTSHMNIKFFSAVRCSREVIPYMRKDKWGRIIFISGMGTRSVRLYTMDNGPICAALTNFGKQLSAQVIGDGIRVNTILPNMTRTERLMKSLKLRPKANERSLEEIEKEEIGKLPIGRFLEPEETAHLVTFLCSDLADGITGQTIAIDGGSSPCVYY